MVLRLDLYEIDIFQTEYYLLCVVESVQKMKMILPFESVDDWYHCMEEC